jgi:hypothetical protein
MIIEQNDGEGAILPARVVPPKNVTEYSLGEQFWAAFEETNSVGILGSGLSDLRQKATSWGDLGGGFDGSFDVFDGTHEIREGYESNYISARNPADVAYINGKIDRETKNREILATTPIGVSLAAGILDPVNLLPFNVFASAAVAKKSIAMTAAEVGATQIIAQTGIEAVAQNTKETLTATESLANIISTGLFAGVIGGAGRALQARPEFDFVKMEEEMSDYVRNGDGSLSAASASDVFVDEVPIREKYTAQGLTGSELEAAVVSDVAKVRLESEGMAGALGLEKYLSFQDPVSRGLAYPFMAMRKFTSAIAEVYPKLGKNMTGIVSEIPVENEIKKWDFNVGEFTQGLNNLFVSYRKGNTAPAGRLSYTKTIISDAIPFNKPAAGKMTKSEFNAEVAKAARRGDIHDVPEVAKAAALLREKIITPLVKRAQELGLLPEELNVKTAESYLTRIWDIPTIQKNATAFTALNKDWLMQKRNAAVARIPDRELMLLRAKSELKDARGNARRAIGAVRKIVDDAQRLLGRKETELKAIKAEVKRAEFTWKKANNQMLSFTPEQFKGENKKYFRRLRDDLIRGKSTKPEVIGGRTETLLEFISKRGGIVDDSGDLAMLGADKWHTEKPFRSRLIAEGVDDRQTSMIAAPAVRKNSADDVLQAAQEAGYFQNQLLYLDSYEDALDVNDLYNLMREELRGNPAYSVQRELDDDVVGYNQYLNDVNEQLDRDGIQIDGMDARTFRDVFDKMQTGKPRKYTTNTPATRARYRELQYQEKRTKERLQQIDASSIKKEAEVLHAAQGVSDAMIVRRIKAPDILQGRKDINQAARAVDDFRADLEKETWYAGLTDEDLDIVADELLHRIIGSPAGRLDYSYKMGEDLTGRGKNVVGRTKALKGRVYDIPDAMVEKYLINDIEHIAHSYVKGMGAQTALYGKFGSLTLEKEIRAIQEESSMLIEKNPDRSAKILQAKDNAIRDLIAMRDRTLGQYNVPDDYTDGFNSATRIVKTLNYMRYLGGMTLSSIPDLGRPVMVHGMNRVFRDGIEALVNNREAFKRAAAQVPESGTGWEVVLNTRARQLADIGDAPPPSSKVEAWLARQSTTFSAVSLMPFWNDATKQFTGVVTQSRIMDDIKSLLDGSITERDKSWLASNFIDAAIGKKIIDQFARHGEVFDTVKIPNARVWDDVDARDVFRAAVRKTVEGAIFSPGLERPLWFNRGIGPLVSQFRSYSFSSMQKMLIPAMQQRDMQTLNAIALMVGLGAMTYAAKESAGGREVSDDPLKWIIEGVDRSGITGWGMEAHNIIEKTTRGAIGLNRFVDSEPMSRYASRSIAESIMGPSLGLLPDLAQVIGGAANMDMTESDIRTLRRLLPYQNHPLISKAFDEAESGIKHVFGIQSTTEE